jgi:4-hydroxy-tetrahydrodipicolinate reductase
MGHALVRCGMLNRSITLAGAVDHAEHPELGTDAGTLAGIDAIDLPLSADLRTALEASDALIDFTLHDAVPANVTLAAELRRAVVIGATGLTAEETEAVMRASAVVPVVWAPNMSVGMNFLFATVKKAASVFGDDYRVEIDETHHIHKKDAPSGTALRLGEKVAEGLDKDFGTIMIHDPEGAEGLRDENKLVMRSFRKGEVIGEHTVTFETTGERVALSHLAHSRDAFAMGALHAAQWVVSRKPGLYDMQDVLGL